MTNWRKIPTWPNYEVSDKGKVRNESGRVLYVDTDRYGYKRVKLYRDGESKNRRINVLVAQAFLDWRPECDVNHKDRNKRNNSVDNLEVVTHRENMRHWMAEEGIISDIF